MRRFMLGVMVLVPSLVVVADLSAEARLVGARAKADDGGRLLTIDHFVKVRSTVPAIAGQTAQIYVRERVQAGAAPPGPGGAGPVLPFLPRPGAPAQVAVGGPA